MNTEQISLNPSQLRAEAARRLWRVLNSESSESLDAVLRPVLVNPDQQAWMSAALYGALRFYPRYKNQLYAFLKKPIKPKEGEVEALLILGMHQLSAMRVKSHAAINETVNACRVLEKDWAIKLVNGILRNFQRELIAKISSSEATDNEDGKDKKSLQFTNEIDGFAHPKWMIKTLKKQWPNKWQEILSANNRQAEMTLRVNEQQSDRETALKLLADAGISATGHSLVDSAIVLDKPVDIKNIPQFESGLFSVQDAAAQISANILIAEDDRSKHLNVLDACAAPGGKTGHLLERLSPDSSLTALDISESRLSMVSDNMNRLGFAARDNLSLIAANATELETWYQALVESVDASKLGESSLLFDRILLDAPCSASGVIRRHPDIKIRRSPQQLAEVQMVQANILQSLWSTLKTGGQLLYATCSVFQVENSEQIKQFVSTHTDAKVIPLNLPESENTEFGSQIFPGDHQRDGFFYALLEKQ